MKKIVCDLCDSTEFVKEGGMFICQGCGTKYSLEEAKSMMREVEGSTAPVSSAPVTTVPMGNPNQQRIDNLLILASTAFEASNNQEAESYCNRVIELDAMSYKAWLLKGKAVGWSSSLGNNRMQEAAHSFCKAIDFAPEDEREDVKNQAVDELKKFGLACISMRKKNFAENPGADQLNGFRIDRKVLLEALAVLITYGNDVGIPEGYQEEIATMMQEAASGGFSTLLLEETNRLIKNLFSSRKTSNSDLQTKYENCVKLLEDAIDASSNDDEADVQRYKDLIAICEHIRDMDCCLDSEKKTMNEKIANAKVKLAELEKMVAEKAAEEKKARIEAYWAAHADEKLALEAEKKGLEAKEDSLTNEIAELNSQIKAAKSPLTVPSEVEDRKIDDQIRALESRRAKLGLFAGKEKKQIDEEIASLNGRRDVLKSKIKQEKHERLEEINATINPMLDKRMNCSIELNKIRERLAAIREELEKDPE